MNKRQMDRLMRGLGYELVRQRKHCVYQGPCGPLVLHKTASDHRAMKNTMAELRRRHPDHPLLAR